MKRKVKRKCGSYFVMYCPCCGYEKLGKFRQKKIHAKNWTSDYYVGGR